MRLNIVGTHWLTVTRKSSIALSESSGSNRSITTTVPPSVCVPAVKPIGAAW